VQRALHRDTGVFETGDVDHTGHLVLVDRVDDAGAIQNRCLHERNPPGHETLVPTGEVIEHHRPKTGVE